MEEAHAAENTGENQDSSEVYVNRNPKATPDEVRLGTFLQHCAVAGRLPGVKAVEGAPEVPGQRSGDYRFILDDGRVLSADLYQPVSANTRSIAAHVMQKSGQATVVVLELGRGNSDRIGVREATHMVQEILDTPGHTINRLLVIRHGVIIVDSSRAG